MNLLAFSKIYLYLYIMLYFFHCASSEVCYLKLSYFPRNDCCLNNEEIFENCILD